MRIVCPSCQFKYEVMPTERVQRTNLQNRYYWVAVVGIPAQHFGYLSEEMHDAFKIMFLKMHAEGKPDTIKSTTALSTQEFSEYVDKCIQFCAEEGIVIPDASEFSEVVE